MQHMSVTESCSTTPPEPTWRRLLDPGLEGVVSFGVVALYLATCTLIRVYPLDRLGQISGLASLALRFFACSIVVITALIVAARFRGGRSFEMTTRLTCAAVAGLASAMVAGGIMVALRGTPWGLNGRGGDVGALAKWAADLHRGNSIPALYPPLSLHILHWYSDAVGLAPELAIKHLQIAGTAAFGPFAYLSWRLLLHPVWALGIGVIAALPLIEPYKPYPTLMLVIFVPLAIKFLKTLQELSECTNRKALWSGLRFGIAFGLIFLTYSGWFQWSAPGLFVATLLVVPWRAAPRRAIYLFGITATVFLVVTGRYLYGLISDPATKIADTYVYFDTKVEPMYIAMWRNDLPGIAGVWPPHGELSGLAMFTLLLLLGFGIAIALGRKTIVVTSLVPVMTGAWLMRFWYAHLMWETKWVQLYPRTTPLILYCLIVLTGYAAYWLVQRLSADSPLRGNSGVIGSLCALVLLFCSAGSAMSDRYMPVNTDPPGTGWLAWNAYMTKWGELPKDLKSEALPWVRRIPTVVPARSAVPTAPTPASPHAE
jgi:hypothetical protein